MLQTVLDPLSHLLSTALQIEMQAEQPKSKLGDSIAEVHDVEVDSNVQR